MFANNKQLHVLSRSRSFFVKLFIQINVFAILLIALISYLMYNSFTGYTFDMVRDYSGKLLSQINYHFEYIDTYAKEYSKNMYGKSTTKSLMYSLHADMQEVLKAMDDLEKSLTSAPFIHSIYVYNGDLQRFYVIGPNRVIRNRDEMYDDEIIQIIDNITPRDILIPIARNIPVSDFDSTNRANVYSYIIRDAIWSKNDLSSGIIINVDANWIFENISTARIRPLGEETSIILVDEAGVVYGHTDKMNFLSNVSDQPYVRDVLDSKYLSGSFNSQINKANYTVTYLTMNSLGIKFIALSPNENLANYSNSILNIIIFSSLFILLFGVFMSYLLSKNFYVPIRNLQRNLHILFEPNEITNPPRNEFAFMTNVFSIVADRLNTLKSFKNSNLETLKRDYIKKLLKSPDTDIDMLPRKFTQYNIDLDINKSILVIVYKIDGYKEFCRKYDYFNQTLNIANIEKVLTQTLAENFKGESFLMNDDNFVSILNIEKECKDYDTLSNILFPRIKKIQEAVSAEVEISLSCAVSRIANNINNLHKIYRDTLELSEYRLLYGQNCLLTPELIDQTSENSFHFPIKEAKILLEALKNRNADELKETFNSIIAYMSDFTITNIRFGISQLSFLIFDTINIIESNSNAVFDIEYFSFINEINSLETLEDISKRFITLFDSIIRKLDETKSDKSYAIVSVVEKYIKEHYSDINLSVNDIAEIVNLSPEYLNKLFRKATSMSISAYINELRLQKSSELLANSNMPTEEILDMIGWGSKTYFYTLFKKRFGVTPTNYRTALLTNISPEEKSHK